MTLEEIIEQYPEEQFMTVPEFDEAVIGVEYNSMRLVYSIKEILNILRYNTSEEDAMEHFTYNIAREYIGEKTAIFIWD